LEARRAAVAELEGLFESGRAAFQRHEATWVEIRACIQERARVTAAESRRLHEEGLYLSKEQALALSHALFAALKDVVFDADIYAAGPQAVVAALQRKLATIMGRPVEPGEVIEGAAAEPQADGAGGVDG
jgi:hypothetical protein